MTVSQETTYILLGTTQDTLTTATVGCLSDSFNGKSRNCSEVRLKENSKCTVTRLN